VEELADHPFMYPPNLPKLGQRFADAWTPPANRPAARSAVCAWHPGGSSRTGSRASSTALAHLSLSVVLEA
jgi:hypothetical protein